MRELTADQVLSTTRAVRRRLDFARPVGDEVVRECVSLALQAPSGSNVITMQFVVVRDEDKRRAIAKIYRECFDIYRGLDGVYVGSISKATAREQAQQQRVTDSAHFLAEHLQDAPALVLACTSAGRIDQLDAVVSAAMLASVLPGMWSFMLAARARGLGTSWTTISLLKEREIAAVLGIPFDEVQQVCLSPLAYTRGVDFKPALRPDPESIIHWDEW